MKEGKRMTRVQRKQLIKKSVKKILGSPKKTKKASGPKKQKASGPKKQFGYKKLLTTVKKSNVVCPLCSCTLANGAPDRVNLVVNGKTVPVFGDILKSMLRKAGITEPKLEKEKVFDIEEFLKLQALSFVNESVFTAGPKWQAIINLAQLLEIKTNFVQYVRDEMK